MVRKSNEDAIYVNGWASHEEMEVPQLFEFEHGTHPLPILVADGMGGHKAGEVASQLIVKELPEMLLKCKTEEDVREALERMNERIFSTSSRAPQLRGMGATVVGMILNENNLRVFNIGDARAYIMSGDLLSQISIDDVPGVEKQGARKSHFITQSLGGTLRPVPLMPHIISLDIVRGMSLLLCSDGLTDVVGDGEIEALLKKRSPNVVASLFKRVLQEGAPDNFSIIVVSFVDDV